jgi:two-component system, cell cycle response regulator
MSARILVIEDNPTNLELMVYLLNAFNHMPLTARDGEEGLEAARRENPDLIICDIDIPNLNGYGVAKALKADPALNSIPLIAVTAFAMVGDKDKVLSAGFDGYISKPIEAETFVAQAEAFLSGNPSESPKTYLETAAPVLREITRQHATVLAVDNLPANLLLIESILSPFGYNVLSAPTPREGLALAWQHTPDVIVSDVHMPGGDGYDFIRAIKAEPALRHIPFIFLSSTAWSDQSIQYGLSLGANRFLFRPIEPQMLLAEIETCLEGRER